MHRFPNLAIAVASLGLSTFSAAQKTSVPSHGTCAIVAASLDNMAFIVDSRLTFTNEAGTTRSCVTGIDSGCKAVLVRPDVLVGVTGVYNDPVGGVDWRPADETRKLLLALPKTLEKADIDSFAQSWLNVLVRHYRENSNGSLPEEGREVSTLLVATKIRGTPYVVRIPISFTREYGFGGPVTQLLFTRQLPELFYAGSCRDHVTTHDSVGVAHPPTSPLPVYWKQKLDAAGNERRNSSSARELAEMLVHVEDVFTHADRYMGTCWVGPPYDVATWAKGETGWTTHFKRSCPQGGVETGKGGPRPR